MARMADYKSERAVRTKQKKSIIQSQENKSIMERTLYLLVGILLLVTTWTHGEK